MRFPPRTAQAGTVRKTVRKWNLGLPLYTYPLVCISAGALLTTLKYCGKHTSKDTS